MTQDQPAGAGPVGAALYFQGSLARAIEAGQVAIGHVRAGRYTDIHTVDAVLAAAGEAHAALREHVEPIGRKGTTAALATDPQAVAEQLAAVLPESATDGNLAQGVDWSLVGMLLLQLAKSVLDHFLKSQG